jgi:hypothetical protein
VLPFHLLSFPSWVYGDVVGELFDPDSDRLLVIARPPAQPDLWAAYVDGARMSYAQHGVESAVDYDRVRDGASTSLFVAALARDGRVVGGLRVQGPYTHVEQTYALREWAGRAGTSELRRQVGRRLRAGVIEVKAVWVDRDAVRHDALTAVLARMFVHLLTVMDVRYALCTAAEHAVPRWQSSGGVVSTAVPAVAYPDDRYRTLVMWWDRHSVLAGMAGQQARAVVRELAQLRRPVTVPTVTPSVA